MCPCLGPGSHRRREEPAANGATRSPPSSSPYTTEAEDAAHRSTTVSPCRHPPTFPTIVATSVVLPLRPPWTRRFARGQGRGAHGRLVALCGPNLAPTNPQECCLWQGGREALPCGGPAAVCLLPCASQAHLRPAPRKPRAGERVWTCRGLLLLTSGGSAKYYCYSSRGGLAHSRQVCH